MITLRLKLILSNLLSLCQYPVYCFLYIHSLIRKEYFESGVDKNTPSCRIPSFTHHSPWIAPMQSPKYSFGQSINACYMVDQPLSSLFLVVAFTSRQFWKGWVISCSTMYNLPTTSHQAPNANAWTIWFHLWKSRHYVYRSMHSSWNMHAGFSRKPTIV